MMGIYALRCGEVRIPERMGRYPGESERGSL